MIWSIPIKPCWKKIFFFSREERLKRWRHLVCTSPLAYSSSASLLLLSLSVSVVHDRSVRRQNRRTDFVKQDSWTSNKTITNNSQTKKRCLETKISNCWKFGKIVKIYWRKNFIVSEEEKVYNMKNRNCYPFRQTNEMEVIVIKVRS